MKKKVVKYLKQLYWTINILTSRNSIQRRLGYPSRTRLLIIHADDIGLSKSENEATIKAMDEGWVNSGSVMTLCGDFEAVSKVIAGDEKYDIGVHLTLTSEWPSFKWSPLTKGAAAATLTDENGSLYPEKRLFVENVSPDDFEKECRLQILKAVESGIDITHIDSHMFAVFSSKEILERYISLGKEFEVPVLLTRELPSWTRKSKDAVVVDRLFCANTDDFNSGLFDYYRRVLRKLSPGLNCLLVHLAFDDDEMKSITKKQTAFGSRWRQMDYDFFTSDECRQILSERNIKLITWREIKEKLMKK